MIARTSTLGTQPRVKRSKGAIRLAEWVKAPAAKPDDESSLSGTHGWKVRTDFPKLSSHPHSARCVHTQTQAHRCRQNKQLSKCDFFLRKKKRERQNGSLPSHIWMQTSP